MRRTSACYSAYLLVEQVPAADAQAKNLAQTYAHSVSQAAMRPTLFIIIYYSGGHVTAQGPPAAIGTKAAAVTEKVVAKRFFSEHPNPL